MSIIIDVRALWGQEPFASDREREFSYKSRLIALIKRNVEMLSVGAFSSEAINWCWQKFSTDIQKMPIRNGDMIKLIKTENGIELHINETIVKEQMRSVSGYASIK